MANLRALVAFLADLEKPDPFVAENSDVTGRFVHAAYENGWVRGGFDWPEWAQTAEAIRLRDDPVALSMATPDQLAKLLTVCIRQDRFVDGALTSAFESGLILRIVQRAQSLLDAETPE